MSRPTYRYMRLAELTIGVMEEEVANRFVEKIIPAITRQKYGNLFKASDEAYTALAHSSRADLFDNRLRVLIKQGVDINDIRILKAEASVINNMTGRGNIGKSSGKNPSIWDNVFFSRRLWASQFNTLTFHLLDPSVNSVWDEIIHPNAKERRGSKSAMREAVKNSVTYYASLAVLQLLSAAFGGDPEWDPRSSDFGKFKWLTSRFAFGGGEVSMLTFLSRMATGVSKSATTGIESKLYGGGIMRDRLDVAYDFFEGKLAPMFATLKTIVIQKDFDRNTPTGQSIAMDLMMPIIIDNWIEAVNDPASAPYWAIVMSEFFGQGANTYGVETNWSSKETNEMVQFRAWISASDFKKANNKAKNWINGWYLNIKTTEEWKNMSPEEKDAALKAERLKIKKKIFRDYGFRPIYK